MHRQNFQEVRPRARILLEFQYENHYVPNFPFLWTKEQVGRSFFKKKSVGSKRSPASRALQSLLAIPRLFRLAPTQCERTDKTKHKWYHHGDIVRNLHRCFQEPGCTMRIDNVRNIDCCSVLASWRRSWFVPCAWMIIPRLAKFLFFPQEPSTIKQSSEVL